MKSTKKYLLVSVFVVLLAFIYNNSLALAQQNLSGAIGVFNLQTAINDSKKGKAAKDQLSKKYQNLEKDLKSQEDSLDKASQSLKKEAATLSQEALVKKEIALSEQVQNFKNKVQSATEEMQKSETEALQPLFDEALKIAENIGKQKGFVMILEAQKAGVIYRQDGLDITAEVVKILDSKQF